MENEIIVQVEGDTQATQPEHRIGSSESDRRSHRHHHRHRHHSSSDSSGKKKKKAKKKVDPKVRKKNIQIAVRIIVIPLALVLLVYLISMGIYWGQYLDQFLNIKNLGTLSTSPTGSSISQPIEEQAAYIGMPVMDGPAQLMNPMGEAYMNARPTDAINDVIDEYLKGTGFRRHDTPQPVKLSFAVYRLPDKLQVRQAYLELSENEAFVKPVRYDLDANFDVSLTNLKTGTVYYYRTAFVLTNQTVLSCSGSFATAAGPRLLEVDGIANVRDVGGWKTTDGKTVRQGLLYRGSELDGVLDSKCKLTSAGAGIMLQQLGIKYEMDLRLPEDGAAGLSPLGANVTHKYYGAESFSLAFETHGKSVMREIFRDLADPANYPVYMHCTGGIDRTGTVCCVLEALLGVSQDDMIRDFELSALYYRTVSRDNIRSVITMLKIYDGLTLQEQAANYLLDCGVTQAEIDSIRSIFLG